MHDTIQSNEGSLLWTLEEIGRLVSGSGNPAETLDNIVHLIQRRFETDVCSVYLLEPDRSQPGAGRDDRPAARERRPRADATHRRAGRPGRRAAAAAGRRRRDDASALQVFPRGRRGRLPLVPRRAGHRSRAAAGRAGRADRRAAHLSSTTRCGCWRRRARSWRRSSARRARSEQFVAPAHQRLRRWRRTCGGAGTTRPRACSASSIPVLWRELRPQPDRPAAADADRDARGAGRAAGAAQPHQLRLPPAAGVPRRRRTPGARATPACSGRGRSPTSRPSSGCTSRMPIYSGGLGILAGDHIKSASDLGIPLVGVGLYYDQGYFRQRLDADGWQHEDYIDVDTGCCRSSRPRSDGVPVTVAIETRTGTIARAGLAARGRPQHAAAARLERRRQPARGSRADRAALRRRRARAHPPGAAARRRRRPRARRPWASRRASCT